MTFITRLTPPVAFSTVQKTRNVVAIASPSFQNNSDTVHFCKKKKPVPDHELTPQQRERRRKNRESAIRSNEKKRVANEQLKKDLKKQKALEAELLQYQTNLRKENQILRVKLKNQQNQQNQEQAERNQNERFAQILDELPDPSFTLYPSL
jgi:septal ring factor EnvC (AmiA/AmiB activator)